MKELILETFTVDSYFNIARMKMNVYRRFYLQPPWFIQIFKSLPCIECLLRSIVLQPNIFYFEFNIITSGLAFVLFVDFQTARTSELSGQMA